MRRTQGASEVIAFRVVENQMNYAYLGDRLSTNETRRIGYRR